MIFDPKLTRRPPHVASCVPYATARTFVRSFRRLFTSPRSARHLYCATAVRHGLARASVSLQVFPERFGVLRSGASEACIRAAADAAYEFAFTCESFWRDLLLEEAPMLIEANAALAAAHVIAIVNEHSRAQDVEVLMLKERRRQGLEVVREFAYHVMGVYGYNRRALREVRRLFLHRGKEATVTALRTSPELFGPFSTYEEEVGFTWLKHPLFRFQTDAASRALARRLPEMFLRAVEAYESRPTIAQVYAAEERAQAAKCALEEASAAARQFPWSIEEYVGETALGLLRFMERHEPPASWENLARQLAPMLPPAAFALARQSAERRRLQPA